MNYCCVNLLLSPSSPLFRGLSLHASYHNSLHRIQVVTMACFAVDPTLDPYYVQTLCIHVDTYEGCLSKIVLSTDPVVANE